MKGWMAATGEDPLQLVRVRDQSFGYADMRDEFLREQGIPRLGANFGLLSCGNLRGSTAARFVFT